MSDSRALRSAIAQFEAIIAEMKEISRRSDSERRGELVRLRRALSNQVMLVREAGATTFGDAIDDPLAREFRLRLSAVLSAIALHQANWPAVSIDEGSDAFRASSANVAQVNASFVGWTRDILSRHR